LAAKFFPETNQDLDLCIGMVAVVATGSYSASPKKRKLSISVSSQMDALKTIYKSLGGPEWARQDNWLSDDNDFSEWQGITVVKAMTTTTRTTLHCSNSPKTIYEAAWIIQFWSTRLSSLAPLWNSCGCPERSIDAPCSSRWSCRICFKTVLF
jgi:hypothetical protein